MRGQYIIPKNSLPAKDDMDGWHDINTIRERSQIMTKAIELFGQDQTLKEYLEGHFNIQDNHKRKRLNEIFTIAVQELCCKPPYFIPHMTMTIDGRYYSPALSLYLLKKRGTGPGTLWYDFKNILEIDSKHVLFSTHAIERIMTRLDLVKIKYTKNILTMALFSLMKLGPIATAKGEPLLQLYNEPLYGNTEPFGYCPISHDKDIIVATTFLLPGMSGTPEGVALRMIGEYPAINNINDLEENKEAFEKVGMTTFVDEKKDDSQKT
jgi:hypothetical protein